MPDVGDAVTLTFETTTGAAVTAGILKPDGTTVTPVSVPESPAGKYPFTFVGTLPGMWRVVFASTTPTAQQVRWVRFTAISAVPPLATPDDVARGWRALTGDEEDVAAALVDQASLVVRARVATVDARIADGTLSAELVAGVVGSMVRDVMQQPPPGLQSWTVDDYTERYYEVERRLQLHDGDLDLLVPAGASTGAFTIRPQGTPVPPRWSW